MHYSPTSEDAAEELQAISAIYSRELLYTKYNSALPESTIIPPDPKPDGVGVRRCIQTKYAVVVVLRFEWEGTKGCAEVAACCCAVAASLHLCHVPLKRH